MARKNINFINLKNGNTFLLDQDNQIKPAKHIHKKALTVSRLYYGDIITHSFKLEKKYSTSQELTLAVELKMYEDLALDMEREYKIFYLQKPTEVENILLIEAFAYDKKAITEKYEETFKKIKHLDYITIPALTFETIYRHEEMPKANDVFIYIGEDEAFLTFYREGHYISSKKLKSLNEMLQELESKNLRPTMEELIEILQTKGVCKENYTLFEYDMYEYVTESFDRIFSTIKNLALHNRNIYNFATLDHVYLKIGNSVIPDLPQLAAGYLPETKIFPLNLYKEYDAYDFIDILSAYYVQDHLDADNPGLNITFYKKKIPFYQTHSGKFAIAAAAGVLISALYPAWQQYEIYQLQIQNETLQTRLDSLKQKSKRLQKEHTALKKEIRHYTQKRDEINRKFDRLRHIADTLLALKSRDEHYTAMLMTINDLLHKYGLTVDQVSQAGEKSLDLEIYSKENKRDTIALFMQDLLSHGFSKVVSNEITLDEDAYKSIVTVKR